MLKDWVIDNMIKELSNVNAQNIALRHYSPAQISWYFFSRTEFDITPSEWVKQYADEIFDFVQDTGELYPNFFKQPEAFMTSIFVNYAETLLTPIIAKNSVAVLEKDALVELIIKNLSKKH